MRGGFPGCQGCFVQPCGPFRQARQPATHPAHHLRCMACGHLGASPWVPSQLLHGVPGDIGGPPAVQQPVGLPLEHAEGLACQEPRAQVREAGDLQDTVYHLFCLWTLPSVGSLQGSVSQQQHHGTICAAESSGAAQQRGGARQQRPLGYQFQGSRLKGQVPQLRPRLPPKTRPDRPPEVAPWRSQGDSRLPGRRRQVGIAAEVLDNDLWLLLPAHTPLHSGSRRPSARKHQACERQAHIYKFADLALGDSRERGPQDQQHRSGHMDARPGLLL
mmetsp:Transcript_27652/g.76047  ORF Transcript_27652/g.76047 Transcript_27652/m.76047 type:complete len:274 (+) Transcript_27652:91-912(+)